MKLMVIGSGIIDSEILKEKVKTEDNNEIDVCKFRFKNFNSIDKAGNKKYSRYLCFAKDSLAKVIISNFIKGQKVFIIGNQEQSEIIDKTQNKKVITTIEITWIEFMGNNKGNEEEKQQIKNNKGIDEIIGGILMKRAEDSQNEIYT